MCYLRGICYAKQNAFDRAKECYKDAVRIDVQCFEAFDQLMKNSLMSPDEEWAFLESLDFDSIPASDASTAQEAAQFVKMLYTTRLSKYKNLKELAYATESLSTHYHLSQNHDLLLAKAEQLFTQCRFHDALDITSSILSSDEYNFSIYPLHLACLYELSQKNTLFLLSHRLADLHPNEPATWLAVGVYYLSISRIAEARRFFSKASMMDPHFGPAWIGFAHTFAAEGEHDQAISAYSTAARLFQGTHLPQLFLGMQNLQLNNLTLAHEYLAQAHSLCEADPLLLNELGVCFFNMNHLQGATQYFAAALQLAETVGADPRAWTATRTNLGHAYRRQGLWEQALEQFEAVSRVGGKDAGVFTSRGLVLLEMGRPWDAVVAFHEALAVAPQDPIASDLLVRGLEEMSRVEGGSGDGMNGEGGGEGETAARGAQEAEDVFENMAAGVKAGQADLFARMRERRRAKRDAAAEVGEESSLWEDGRGSGGQRRKDHHRARESAVSGYGQGGEESMMMMSEDEDD